MFFLFIDRIVTVILALTLYAWNILVRQRLILEGTDKLNQFKQYWSECCHFLLDAVDCQKKSV